MLFILVIAMKLLRVAQKANLYPRAITMQVEMHAVEVYQICD